ncbi:MAG: hypothetical protein DRO00_08385 [Thermoproteota archaeon]|nr:MAG: hypothetical protein DRO00_08385 [Candidatus Korarchaeota archaeon]
MLRDTVAIPIKVYARDKDGDWDCNESMIPLEFREVVIRDVPHVFQKDPKKGCYEAVATSILKYFGKRATFEEVMNNSKNIAEKYGVVDCSNGGVGLILEVEPQVMIIEGIPVMLFKEFIVNNRTTGHVYAGVILLKVQFPSF